MALYTKEFLSQSVNGRGIEITANATPGTQIHQAVTGTDDIDEVWLWGSSSHTDPVLVTVEFGGTTVPDDVIPRMIHHDQGAVLLVPGLILQNGLWVRVFAATLLVITIHGFVNRINA